MPISQPHVTFDSIVHADWIWMVNGKRASERRASSLSDKFESDDEMSPFYADWPRGLVCAFCRMPMETPTVRFPLKSSSDWEVERCYRLANCPNCCHWEFRGGESTNKCMDAPTVVVAASVAKKLDTPLPKMCSAELALLLRRDPSLWHSMEPTRMERLVADIFRANYRNAEVFHVGKTGDLGIDVLFVDGGDEDWLIQVKRRESPCAAEGFDTLQRLLGTLVLEGKVRGIIATTAKKFSRQLLKQKHRAENRGYTIELLDRGKLNQMLNPMLPNRPWLGLMKADYFRGLDAEVRGSFVSRTTAPGECLF